MTQHIHQAIAEGLTEELTAPPHIIITPDPSNLHKPNCTWTIDIGLKIEGISIARLILRAHAITGIILSNQAQTDFPYEDPELVEEIQRWLDAITSTDSPPHR